MKIKLTDIDAQVVSEAPNDGKEYARKGGVWVEVTSGQGPKGDKGDKGDTGNTGATGPGVPTGGTTGQMLVKTSATDFATQWVNQPANPLESIIVAAGGETEEIVAGEKILTFRMPYALNLQYVRASLTSASSDGDIVVNVDQNGATILGSKISIDVTELTSTTAATQPTVTVTALADDAEITIDVQSAGTGARGLKVTLVGRRP